MFYLLSLITGVLECGGIVYGVVHSLPLWKILCFPLAYHIGNLFPKPFSLNYGILRIMCVLSAVLGLVLYGVNLSDRTDFVLRCLVLFLTSAVIQSLRSGMKSDGNRLLKRVFRVVGFILAPLVVLIPDEIMLFSSVVALLSIKECSDKSSITCMFSQNGFSFVMLFHQLHYFFYAHITLASMSLLFSCSSNSGVVISAILFCGTWVTYISVEPVVSRITKRFLTVFYVGHIGISVLLLLMYYVASVPIFIVLWLMTGFGGGVVYTISAKAKEMGYYNKDSMVIAENIGHTLGLLIAVGISVLWATDAPRIMLIFGAVSALLAVVSMILITRRG